MRYFITFSLLLMSMTFLIFLGQPTTEGYNPLLLASIGFVILAAYSAAELASKLALPRVTGFIFAGLVLGPQLFDYLTLELVDEIRMFSTLALGLIALQAGLEFGIKDLKANIKTLSLTILLKAFLLSVLVGGGSYLLLMSPFGLSTSLSHEQVISLSVLFAALAIGTSPAIVLAVRSETGAKGRIADLALGAAILKDLVVVLAVAVGIAVSSSLIEGGGVSADAFTSLGVEILSSILVGGLVSGILYLYMRFVRRQMLIFVGILVVAVAEASQILHLELLLTFITAGFLVRNFTPFEHQLHDALVKVALPVFVIFFTNAGASLDLQALVAVAHFATALVALRAVAYFLSGYTAARVFGETAPVRRLAWLSYLPQAGVTLGLISIASSRLPGLAQELTDVGMAVVALNLLVGPIAMRIALSRAGELPLTSATPDGADTAVAVAAETESRALPLPEDLLVLLQEHHDRVERLLLDNSVIPISRYILGVVKALQHRLERGYASEWTAQHQQFLEKTVEKFEQKYLIESEKFIDSKMLGRDMPTSFPLPWYPPCYAVDPSDNLMIRIRKVLVRLRLALPLQKGAQLRYVPLKTSIISEYSLRVTRFQTFAEEQMCRVMSLCLSEIAEATACDDFPHECWERLRLKVQRFEENLVRELKLTLEDCRKVLVVELSRYACPGHRFRILPLSSMAELNNQIIRQRATQIQRWQRNMDALTEAVGLHAALRLISQEVSATCHSITLGPVLNLQNRFLSEYAFLQEAFERVLKPVEHADSGHVSEGSAQTVRPGGQAGNDLQAREMGNTSEIDLKNLEEVIQKFQASALQQATEISTRGELAGHFATQTRSYLGRYELVSAAVTEHWDEASFAWDRVEIRRSQPLAAVQSLLISGLAQELEEQTEMMEVWLEAAFVRCDEILSACLFAIQNSGGARVQKPDRTDGVNRSAAVVPTEGVLDREAVQRAATQAARVLDEITERSRQFQERVQETIEGFLLRCWSLSGKSRLADATAAMFEIRSNVESFFGSRRNDFLRLSSRMVARASQMVKELLPNQQVTTFHKAIDRQTFSATTIKGFLESSFYFAESDKLPALYKKLFQILPLQEMRFFTVRRDLLEGLVGRASRSELVPRTLIIGEPCMGRTSMINLLHYQVRNRKVVRLDPVTTLHHPSPVVILARQLRCDANTRAVAQALERMNALVLVDNLESWWDPARPAELDALFNLSWSTRNTVHWVVTLNAFLLPVFQSVFEMRSLFTDIIALESLSRDETFDSIIARHRLGGIEAVVRSHWGRSWQEALFADARLKVLIRIIAQTARGNLGLSLHLWMRAIERIEEEQLILTQARTALPDFSFLSSFNEESSVVLRELVRFGPRTDRQIRAATGLSDRFLARELDSLQQATLVEPADAFRQSFRVPPLLRARLSQVMK